MLGGSIVIESVFAFNGLGSLAWVSIARSDLPVIQAIVLLLATIFVFLTFISDLLNAFLDPRIRSST
jgi:peptide/nickel transport system permease protein